MIIKTLAKKHNIDISHNVIVSFEERVTISGKWFQNVCSVHPTSLTRMLQEGCLPQDRQLFRNVIVLQK